MKNKVILILMIFLVFFVPQLCVAQEFYRPVMHYTFEDLAAMHLKRNLRASSLSTTEILPAGKMSLLSNLDIDSSRDQLACGNCWVWAHTAALEIAYKLASSNKKRFSIQYVNSNYNNGGYGTNGGFACYGATIDQFTKFYNQEGLKLIPLDNQGADFVDGASGVSCNDESEYNCSARLSTDITETPSVQMESLSLNDIQTHEVEQAVAISNIKSELNAGRAVIFTMLLPSWNDFYNYWNYQTEDVIFDLSAYNGSSWSSSSGGHAVVITGYDDTSSNPDEHYWEVLNSWGVSTQRPNGTFHLKMHINYDSFLFYSSSYAYYLTSFYALKATFSDFPQITPTETPTDEPTIEPTPTETPTDEPTAEPTPTEIPTDEPTIEPTPTETATDEPTIEPTPTENPTDEPTAEPSPTITFTPPYIPSSTPTLPPPTSTPKYTPEPEQTSTSVIYGHIRDVNYSGVAGITVSLNDRTTKTDKTGAFIFQDFPFGEDFILNFSRQGYVFEPNEIKGTAEDIIHNYEIITEPDPIYEKCRYQEIPVETLNLLVDQIYNYTYDAITLLNNSSESRYGENYRLFHTVFLLSNNLKNKYNTIKAAISEIPSFSYLCKQKNKTDIQCTTQSHQASLKKIRRNVEQMTNILKKGFTLTGIYNSNKRSFMKKNLQKGLTNKVKIMNILAKVPKKSSICE